MSDKRSIWTTLAALLLCLSFASLASAQDNGGAPPTGGAGGGGGGGGGANGDNGGGRRRFDPQQMMQYRMTQIKEDLGASDDEWNAMQPKVQKVMELQFASMRGRFGGGRRGGGGGFGGPPGGGPPGGADDDQAQNPVQKAVSDLRAAVNANASADDLAKKLQALRDARAAAQAEVTKAQADLKSLLTQRQEAQLVIDGVLE